VCVADRMNYGFGAVDCTSDVHSAAEV
jgi:hypothetical protein